jgi:uncharacterized membrane protein
MQIRNKRDFWSGVMFLTIGILFVILSRQYQLGSAAKMGPGYFPTVLGGMLAALGAFICLGSTAKSTPKTDLMSVGWRELLLVLLAVVVFALLLPKLGMVIALIALIFISARASHEFGWRDTALATVFLLVLSYVVFVWGLELQFPVWPPFLTK